MSNLILLIIRTLEQVFLPIILLLVRLKIAKTFFYSGLESISNWNTTLYAFANEFKVPYISASFAAYSSTAIELICPVFIAFGFMTRFACIPLLVMTGVIYFTYSHTNEEIYWALLLGALICQGAGKLSLDYLIKRKFT